MQEKYSRHLTLKSSRKLLALKMQVNLGAKESTAIRRLLCTGQTQDRQTRDGPGSIPDFPEPARSNP